MLNPLQSDFRLLRDLLKKYPHIVGVDEVGRGALAGPIVVAAIEITQEIPDIFDSKKIPRQKREFLAIEIIKKASQVKFGQASNYEIDSLGVSQALKLAYQRALENISADLVLTDNFFLPDSPHLRSLKGDQIFYPTAAASIVAKVFRDQLMRIYHGFYPRYDWINNVGYGTSRHYEGLRKYGISDLHRQSFAIKKGGQRRGQSDTPGLSSVGTA